MYKQSVIPNAVRNLFENIHLVQGDKQRYKTVKSKGEKNY